MADTPTFSYNRDQILRRSLRQVGAIAAGETPGAQEISDAADALNAMVAEWQATGIHIWKEKEATLFLQPKVYNYPIGALSTASVCPSGNLTILTLGGAGYAAGSTVFGYSPASGATLAFSADGNSDFNTDFNVDFGGSVPAAAVGDNFGVMMSNNQIFWTTILALTATTLTIPSLPALPQPVNGNAQAFVYRNLDATSPSPCAIYRPLRVLNVRRILWSSLIETMVTPLARLDYRNMPNKTTGGVVTQYFYDPQMVDGQFWAWPCPQDSLCGLNMTYMEPIYDFNTAADYPDFPQEWVNAIVWNLSNELTLEYDVGGERAARIERRAAETLDRVSGWDREPESFFLGVNFDQSAR